VTWHTWRTVAQACAGCGAEFQRPEDIEYDICLGCQTARRLSAAGITPDDPALTQVREWNAAVRARAQDVPAKDGAAQEGTT
jgi:hypothetical protein